MGLFGAKKKTGGAFQFRISDSVEVPMRGYLLRLKLASGDPAVDDLAPGKRITLRAPSGAERVVVIKDHAITQGNSSQSRLDRTREFDVIVAAGDAIIDDEIADIGWTASGPHD